MALSRRDALRATAALGLAAVHPSAARAAGALEPAEKDLISSPEMLAGIITVDYPWLAANRAGVLGRWNAWVSS